MPVAKEIVELLAGRFRRARQMGGSSIHNACRIGANEFGHPPAATNLGTFLSSRANHQYRLAQRRSFLLHTAEIGDQATIDFISQYITG